MVLQKPCSKLDPKLRSALVCFVNLGPKLRYSFHLSEIPQKEYLLAVRLQALAIYCMEFFCLGENGQDKKRRQNPVYNLQRGFSGGNFLSLM
jgi:hypothetical protein